MQYALVNGFWAVCGKNVTPGTCHTPSTLDADTLVVLKQNFHKYLKQLFVNMRFVPMEFETCLYTVYLVILLVPAVFVYCAKPLGAPEDEFKLDYLSFDYCFGISYGICRLLKTKMFPESHRPAKNLFPFSFIFFSFSAFFFSPRIFQNRFSGIYKTS